MTGTETAALRLALGVLRRSIRSDLAAKDVLRGVNLLPYRPAAYSSMWCVVSYRLASARLVRARLALYLRAVLRAERGDCGPVRCGRCGDDCEPTDDHCYVGSRAETAVSVPMTPTYHITPLWQAPGVRGAR